MSDNIEQIVNAALALSGTDQQTLLAKLLQALGSNLAPGVLEQNSDYASVNPAKGSFPIASKEDTSRRLMENLDRITQQPGIMGGKACIRGMRVTVGMIIGQLAGGAGINDLLADYPYLEREDIVQALRYAAWRAEEREIDLLPA